MRWGTPEDLATVIVLFDAAANCVKGDVLVAQDALDRSYADVFDEMFNKSPDRLDPVLDGCERMWMWMWMG